MALNTQYKKQSLDSEHYKCHVGLLPTLSKCLLTNIVFGLNLVPQFCNLMEQLPIGHVVELLDEANLCLKELCLKNCLRWTSVILRAASNKLAVTEFCSKVFFMYHISFLFFCTRRICHLLFICFGKYSDFSTRFDLLT